MHTVFALARFGRQSKMLLHAGLQKNSDWFQEMFGGAIRTLPV
jgi:hypothetical protein